MKRLFDSAKLHSVAWVQLHDVDRYWAGRIPTMHPEAVLLYYSFLRSFVGLAVHLIASHSRNIIFKGGCLNAA